MAKYTQLITYEFCCESCNFTFEKELTADAKRPKTCPQCKKRSVHQVFGISAGTVYRGTHDARTCGQASEANKRRLGKELTQKLFEDDPIVQARQEAKKNSKWALPKSVDLNDAKSVERYIEGDN